MDRDIQLFIVKSLKSLQNQIDDLKKENDSLNRRLWNLEPPIPEGEYIVRNAKGELVINIQPDRDVDHGTTD